MTYKKSFFLTSLFLVLLGFTFQEKKITIYLIGDSTIADKQTSAFPETGWGTPFKTFFDHSVVIENHAKNGRSTKSFIDENRWSPIHDQLKEGDYVFIQFGHNDEVKEKVGRYSTPDEYKANLKKFVEESRSKKANPVLLTPVARRKFDEHGKVMETHAEYSPLVREVASETNTPLIDLDARSQNLLQQFGEENSELLFLHLQPGEHPNYPAGKSDNTHFSELGARKVAQIVLAEIVALRLELANRIINNNKPKTP